ncbi:hypothetical protein [Parablautia muri]|uniref:YceG-like family protein n=1 Tax=Parablautia muri TaxID=2320879 RepID=A0A9X5BGA2_9FIRM|nr:hypothetical protein [Parablautia muri]NBJ93484.1 hypothetical protein [Parablautia muri]
MMNLKYYLRGLGIGIVVTALIMEIAVGGRKQVLSDEEIMERARELGMVEESTVLADTVAGQSANAASGPDAEAKAKEPEKSEIPTPLEKTPQPEDGAKKTPSGEDEAASPAAITEKTAVPSAEKTPVPSAEKITEPEATLAPREEDEPDNLPVSTMTPDIDREDIQTESPATTPEETPIPAETSPMAEAAASQTGSIQINSGEGSYTVSVKLQEAGLISSASEFDRYLFQNGYDRKIRTGVFEIPSGADLESIAKIITRAE